MALVSSVTGAIARVTLGIQSIRPAFDLDTAVGAQLDAIGLWVGQSRIIPQVLLLGYFGFADNVAALPFGELSNPSVGGRFYELGEDYTGTTILNDNDYRLVLRARIVRNQYRGTLAELEQAMQYIFGVGASVIDNGDLTLSLVVHEPITQTEQALLNALDLLPRPAGVRFSSITYAP